MAEAVILSSGYAVMSGAANLLPGFIDDWANKHRMPSILLKRFSDAERVLLDLAIVFEQYASDGDMPTHLQKRSKQAAQEVKQYYLETRANPHFHWLITKSKAAEEATLMDTKALRYFLGDPHATPDMIRALKLPRMQRLLFSHKTMCNLLTKNLEGVERFIADTRSLRVEVYSTRNSMYGHHVGNAGPPAVTPDVDTETVTPDVGIEDGIIEAENEFDNGVAEFTLAWDSISGPSVWA